MKNAFANPRADALHRCARDIHGNRRTEDGGNYESVQRIAMGDGERELNRVHMSPKRVCHRVEKRRYIWCASICRSPLI